MMITFPLNFAMLHELRMCGPCTYVRTYVISCCCSCFAHFLLAISTMRYPSTAMLQVCTLILRRSGHLCPKSTPPPPIPCSGSSPVMFWLSCSDCPLEVTPYVVVLGHPVLFSSKGYTHFVLLLFYRVDLESRRTCK